MGFNMTVKMKANITSAKYLLLLLATLSSTLVSCTDTSEGTSLFNLRTTDTIKPQPRAVELDLQQCYYDLLQAAVYDSIVTQSDFITFVQLSSDGELGFVNQWGIPINGFNMLNPEFVGIYNLYACGDPLIGCPSIEGIDIGVGGSNLQNTDGGDGGLLSSICEDVYDVINELLPSEEVTKSPTGAGGTSPTVSPSSTGTSEDNAPTYYPSYIPSKNPTGSPTTSKSPTGSAISTSPTMSPIGSPTRSPIVASDGSISPTYYPSYLPSKSPVAPPIAITSCPPAYIPNNIFYEPLDKVTNPNDSSGGIDIYECKELPYTPWCGQAAYEPGLDSTPWSEAWTLVGQCTDQVVTTVAATTEATATKPVFTTVVPEITDPVTTTDSPVGITPPPSPVVDPNVPVIDTPPPVPVVDPNVPTTVSPTASVVDPQDPPYSGPLPIEFKYEVGNDRFLNAQAITTGEPENDMMQVLLDSAMTLIDDVVQNTFTRRGLRSYSVKVRMLQVTHSSESVSIGNLTDIFCPSSEPGNVLCQKVTCLTELILSNEPKLETELRFKNNLFKAIDAGDMTFKEGSGVVYSSSPRAISVVTGVVESEIEEPEGPVDGGDNGNDDSKNWVVPVSITFAVVGILILVFLIGYFVSKKRQRNEAEIVSLDGESLSGDLKEPDVHVRRSSLRHLVVDDGDKDTTAKSKQDGKNPFFASLSSSSGTTSSKKSKKSKKSGSRSPSSSSSSSNISSSTEDLEERKPAQVDDPANVVMDKNSRDIGIGGLGQTTDLGQSTESSRSMYRAGVEALLKESAPEELENVDELMNEYAGREEELIGQLSSMLATMNRSSNIGLEQEEDDDGTQVSSVSSMTSGQEHPSAPTGYNEVQGQITSALDGKSPTEVAQDDRKAAAAAAAATLFTGVSTKNIEMGEWSSDSDSDDSSGSSSSSEGSSEWSTDEGFSSMDTSLETNGSEVVNTTPSMLAAIGVAESITKQVGVYDVDSLSSKSDDENNATRQELSQAIQAGDWTAVATTAALLAKDKAPGRSDLSSSMSDTSVSSGMSGSTLGQVSLERASEFAKLVEAGDWEAVMKVASRYEGASESGTDMSIDDNSAGSNRNDSPKSIEQSSIRAEVEELVRQVVPDEIDNIDEMMTQFRGREQDLINTLWTMQDQKVDTPGTESPNDLLYASPGIVSEAPSSASVFESDSSARSPFWDESHSTTNDADDASLSSRTSSS